MRAWALIENEQPLQCIELDDPQPKGTEVIVEVSHCGVCHSDLHIHKGWYDLGDGNKLVLTERGISLPRALGHEIVGRALKVGPDAQGVKIGDNALVYPWIGCGRCNQCQAGQENLCSKLESLGVIKHGGFASQVVAPHPRYLFPIGDLDPAWAATLACSGLTVYSAIKKLMPIEPDEPVLVIGCGGLGLTAVNMLRALGHRNILAADIDQPKLAAADEAGATFTVNSAQGNATQLILDQVGAGVRASIDFVNTSETVKMSMAVLDRPGKHIIVGVGSGECAFSLPAMIFRARSIISSVTGSPQELQEVINLAQAGKLAPLPISLLDVSKTNEAMDMLKKGQVIGRIVLTSCCN